MKFRNYCLILALFFANLQLLYAQTGKNPVPLNKYLEFARASANWTWDHYDSLEMAWRSSLDPENIFGYRSPGRFLEMAAIYATLYKMEGSEEYAERALKTLLKYDIYKEEYPEEAVKQRYDYSNGTPALPDFFTAMRYIRTFVMLKEMGYLKPAQQKHLESVIAHSVEYTLQSQEWGSMNRAALRAETLAWAVRAIPDHPDIKHWEMYMEALGFDNFGNWEIEDATIYHAVWLYSLLGYAEARDYMDELFKSPEIYYYSQYFLNLMCPDYMIPDFGDANWRTNWSRYLVFFEAAACAYHDPEMKWAGQVMAQQLMNWEAVSNTGLAYLLLDAYRFGTDDIVFQKPDNPSMEVMEDMVGKKIVFRDGWSPGSSYLLLNYRDEGDGGLIYRNYLRDAIPVEEEKMTHGHADENSIVLLMKDGSILLHDGGYRDYMPSGPYGAYRQDYFHNRLCVRPEKIWFGQKQGEYRFSVPGQPEIPSQSLLEFLRNAGSYRKVRTQKVDFLTFSDFDYSRTRLIDDKMGYEWDRIIIWVKDPGIYVVFDVMKATEEGFFTAANIWHTRKIISRGSHWYDTEYDSLNDLALNTDTKLWIHFPKNHYRFEHTEKEQRYYQEEYLISEFSGQHFEPGQHIGFATILVPHNRTENPAVWIENIKFIDSEREGDGMSVRIQSGDKTIHLGIKCDLRMDVVRDYRRPKYTYESGKIVYDDLETNADLFYTERSDDEFAYTIVNVTRLDYEKNTLFEAKPNYFYLSFDGSRDKEGIGKVRYWREKRNLK